MSKKNNCKIIRILTIIMIVVLLITFIILAITKNQY